MKSDYFALMESTAAQYLKHPDVEMEFAIIEENNSIIREPSISMKRVMAYVILGWSLTAFICLFIGLFLCQ